MSVYRPCKAFAIAIRNWKRTHGVWSGGQYSNVRPGYRPKYDGGGGYTVRLRPLNRVYNRWSGNEFARADHPRERPRRCVYRSRGAVAARPNKFRKRVTGSPAEDGVCVCSVVSGHHRWEMETCCGVRLTGVSL